jgi:hypothetical protein
MAGQHMRGVEMKGWTNGWGIGGGGGGGGVTSDSWFNKKGSRENERGRGHGAHRRCDRGMDRR